MPHPAPRPNLYPSYFDTEQLAERLGVHRNTLLRWRKERAMPLPLKFANRLRWKVETIDAWEKADFAPDWEEPER